MNARILFVVIFLFITLQSNLFSQEDKNGPNHKFNFYVINGYAVSYEFNESFRLHLDFAANYGETDNEGERIYTNGNNETIYKSDGGNKSNAFAISISPQFILPLYITQYGMLYAGCGPEASYYRHNNDSHNREDLGNNLLYINDYHSEQTSYSAGIILFAGLKGYLAKNISLFAEAHLNGGRHWTETKYFSRGGDNINANENSTNETGSGWFFSATYVRIGVAIGL